MITCFTGTPGGGKTYAAVLLLLDMVKKGRTIYTNMDGLDDESCRVALSLVSGVDREVLECRLFHLSKEKMLVFWDIAPPGAVVIIDEVHKLWSSRTYASESNKTMAEWCSTHRHHGYDVILITQALDKLDGHVRSLIEWTHRCRKVNFLGSWVNKSYYEYVYSEDDERNCLSRKRKSYDPVIFKCYKSYAAKDIKEKGIGKNTNILRHPVFYAIPCVFILMVVMLFRSGLAHGDVFGSKKHQKDRMAAFKKAAPGSEPVSLNKTQEGYWSGGRWVALPAKITDKGIVPLELGKDTPGAAASPGVSKGVGATEVYHAPATVVVEGDKWTFTDYTGRVVGFVRWVHEDSAVPPASRAEE
jgi:zona occludens toxin (predicted ATPase)